eukprot:Blabericola_migrator_1__2098@NODE_157_length_12604_cov_91_609237_g137_i0_p4_GENE_NODE_157_length_12604_cov_91_609237_g137_i0NODE_157_length_12604_cov_91_609237_g137_i0_p4_ORF_typecomplete_len368_score82_07_NODE_157_length_12604_cov_91_609237_g137_i051206223
MPLAVLEFGCLIEVASTLESYDPQVLEGLVFGVVVNDEYCVKAASAWPLVSLERIKERIPHRCLASKLKDIRCVGAYTICPFAETSDEALLNRAQMLWNEDSVDLFVAFDSVLFQPSRSGWVATPDMPQGMHGEAFQQRPAADVNTLALISQMKDHLDPGLTTLIKVWHQDEGKKLLPLKFKADYSAFILHESLFRLQKNIAGTLPTFTPCPVEYYDGETRELVVAASRHQRKLSQMFLAKASAYVTDHMSAVREPQDMSEPTVSHVSKHPAGDMKEPEVSEPQVSHLNAIDINTEVDPVVLRQIQHCVSSIIKMEEKRTSPDAQRLTRVLDKTIELAQLTAKNCENVASFMSEKKHKQARRAFQAA